MHVHVGWYKESMLQSGTDGGAGMDLDADAPTRLKNPCPRLTTDKSLSGLNANSSFADDRSSHASNLLRGWEESVEALQKTAEVEASRSKGNEAGRFGGGQKRCQSSCPKGSKVR